MLPSERFRNDIDEGLIEFDQSQQRVIEKFDQLHIALAERSQPEQFSLKNLLQKLKSKPGAQIEPVKGLYVWGGVGRGKTYLMDIFFDCLPGERKRRTHFYRFMQEVHQSLVSLQGESDPLKPVAQQIARDIDVLCFDEFFVVDIGDAMILSGLLSALFDAGVVLVATSNVIPDRLYENGLQRERFLPAIDLLKRHTEVVEIADGTDYRLQRLSNSELYLAPIDSDTNETLLASFHDLAPDRMQISEHHSLSILGREIKTRAFAEDVVWFDFQELCDGPRSAFDYVEIAKLFHALILSDVPQMRDSQNDAARRFISLIDELYDRRVKLIVSAAVPVDEIYLGSSLDFEMERTRSRLVEMQSHEYLCREHRI